MTLFLCHHLTFLTCPQSSGRAVDQGQVPEGGVLSPRQAEPLRLWLHGRLPDEEGQRGLALPAPKVRPQRDRRHPQVLR